MKKLLTLFMVAIAATNLFASDIHVGGIWYDFDDTNLTASVTYRGSSYSSYSNEYTGSVVIPASVYYNSKTYSVTTIGDYAFRDCSGLTSVIIPNSVTTIGYGAFESCRGLTSVTIPNSVTTIGNNAFCYVNNIVYNGIATGSPWGAKCVNGYIDGYLVYSDATKTKLCGCSSAITGAITIPNSVTTIGLGAFDGCSGLTSVTIPNSVTTIGDDAFRNCSDLTSVTIGNSVTTIGYYAFYGCSGLTSVTIGNSVTTIGDLAFFGCSGLTSITIPNSVTTIGDYAFVGRSSLTSITCYATTPPTCGSYCFAESISIFVPLRSIDAYKQADVWKDLAIYSIENVSVSVNNSAYGSVQGGGHQQNKNVILTAEPTYGYHFTQWADGNTDNPRSFVFTQDTSFTAQFAINIYSFDIQTADSVMGSVTGTKGNYEHGTSLTLSAKSNYGYHFDHWSDGNKQDRRTISLTKDTSLTAYFAKNAYSVSVLNSQYGTIQGADKYDYLNTCTLIVIPDFGYNFIGWSDGNTDNPRSLLVTQDTTFAAQFEQQSTITGRCGKDLTWTLHEGVLTIMGSGDMYDNDYDSWSRWADQITIINLPDGLTSIGSGAFAECSNVKEITIPTTITLIGESAFYNCSGLRSVTIPIIVTSIGDYAFANCTGLRTITCFATNPPLAENYVFYGVSQYTKTYVLASSLEDYQFALGWRDLNLLPLGSTETTIATDTVIIQPSVTEATFTWPQNDQAAGYSIEITKDGVVFCTLKFNAQGQLTGIAFAPSRGGQAREMPAAMMTANGWQFTVTGLNQASKYGYTLDALNASQQSIKHYEGEFATDGYVGLYTLPYEGKDGIGSAKFIHNNQLLILHNGNLYHALGGKVR